MLYEIAPEYKGQDLRETGDSVDFGYEDLRMCQRFRANYSQQKNGIAAGASARSPQEGAVL